MKKVRILTKKRAKSEWAKSEWPKLEWPKSEQAKSKWPKSEQAKSEQAKSEQAKSEQLKFPQITTSSMELFLVDCDRIQGRACVSVSLKSSSYVNARKI